MSMVQARSALIGALLAMFVPLLLQAPNTMAGWSWSSNPPAPRPAPRPSPRPSPPPSAPAPQSYTVAPSPPAPSPKAGANNMPSFAATAMPSLVVIALLTLGLGLAVR
eukprot:TRINITY_DN107235_c0_g1_i1.p1 TRINITY_DN107235_c0_g1~~TRINITY_DN107235_c0_g1_i1.p1  ORF type:complete len:108 (-),score=17.66 TRINITY_DN107235_c0_g1_i1:143-466(-)